MQDYKMTTRMSWGQTISDLAYTFSQWGVERWKTNEPKGKNRVMGGQLLEDRRVIIEYKKNGASVVLTMDKQERAIDNLRVLYKCLEEMRMQERRGVSEVFHSAYLQLPQPEATTERDPYEVLGVLPNSPIEVCEAVYRTMASKYHPDSNPSGDTKRFIELKKAIEKIRSNK